MAKTFTDRHLPGAGPKIPDPPPGGRIRVAYADGGLVISWSKQLGGLVRLMKILLVGVPLCATLVGFVSGLIVFVANSGPNLFILGLVLFAVLIFSVLTRGLYLLLRHEAPESVTLMSDRIRYDTGSPVLLFIDRRMLINYHNLSLYAKMFRRREVDIYSRNDSPRFLIEGSGLRQLLKIRDSSGRETVVGESLRNTDQLWLARILNQWRDDAEQ